MRHNEIRNVREHETFKTKNKCIFSKPKTFRSKYIKMFLGKIQKTQKLQTLY